MEEYIQLLVLIAPIFIIISAGYALRASKWVPSEVDAGLMNLLVRFLYPCLILSVVLDSDAIRSSANIIAPPVVGFSMTALGMGVGYLVARAMGYRKGAGLRTFCFAAGVANYGYIPIPLIQQMWGQNELAVLLVHNAGVELAMWTIGVAIVSGSALQESLKKALNPTAITLIVGVVLNLLGVGDVIPAFLSKTISSVAVCSIPIGLLMIGMTLKELAKEGEPLFEARSSLGSVFARMLLMPLMILLVARLLPLSVELKRVMLIQGSMPAAVFPIVIARHYKGQPMVATRIFIATTIVGIFTIPLWIRFGVWLLGV